MDRRLTQEDWMELDTILKVLQPFERITTRLQAEKITPSDFFGLWEELKFDLVECNGIELADNLRNCMRERELTLYNDIIFASVFLDPRYRFLLTERESQRFVHLHRISIRLILNKTSIFNFVFSYFPIRNRSKEKCDPAFECIVGENRNVHAISGKRVNPTAMFRRRNYSEIKVRAIFECDGTKEIIN